MCPVTGFLTWRSQQPLCHTWPWKTFLCLSKFNFLFCKIGTSRTAPKLLIKQDTISKAPCPGGGGHSQRDATVISLVITANNRVFVSWSFWQSRRVGRRLFLSRWKPKIIQGWVLHLFGGLLNPLMDSTKARWETKIPSTRNVASCCLSVTVSSSASS